MVINILRQAPLIGAPVLWISLTLYRSDLRRSSTTHTGTNMRFQSFREFDDGEIIGGHGFDIVLHRRSLGDLVLPTGNLIACDPLQALDTEPFTIQLEPGPYGVHLIIAELRDEKRSAYAVVTVKPTESLRWEVATLPPPPNQTIFERHEEVGYSVDSTLGAFLDSETAGDILNYHQLVMPEDNDFERHIWGRIKKRRRHGVGWATIDLRRDLMLPAEDGRNLLVFDAGYGDGYYTTYLGFDEDDELSSIVTDFEVLDMRFPSFPMKSRSAGSGT